MCLWTTKQRLMIEDIAAGSNAIILATSTGQVYTVSLDRLVHPNKKNEHGKRFRYALIKSKIKF